MTGLVALVLQWDQDNFQESPKKMADTAIHLMTRPIFFWVSAPLMEKCEGKQKETAQTQLIPVAQHILERYPILSLEEKNRLWKLVLKKATIYRSPDNEVTIRIYSNLPK